MSFTHPKMDRTSGLYLFEPSYSASSSAAHSLSAWNCGPCMFLARQMMYEQDTVSIRQAIVGIMSMISCLFSKGAFLESVGFFLDPAEGSESVTLSSLTWRCRNSVPSIQCAESHCDVHFEATAQTKTLSRYASRLCASTRIPGTRGLQGV